MSLQPVLFRFSIIISTLLLSACIKDQVVEKESYSGFLSDYSQLLPVELDSGRMVSVWAHPEFKNKKYKKLIIDPVQFYPKPQIQNQVKNDFLVEMKKQMDSRILSMAQKDGLPLTNKPGGKVLRLQPAIAAIKVNVKGFAVNEVIPIRLLISAVELAVGGRDYDVTIYLEYRLVDSLTNEVFYRGVRKGNTESLANNEEDLSMGHAQELLDNWGMDFHSGFLRFKNLFIRPKNVEQ